MKHTALNRSRDELTKVGGQIEMSLDVTTERELLKQIQQQQQWVCGLIKQTEREAAAAAAADESVWFHLSLRFPHYCH